MFMIAERPLRFTFDMVSPLKEFKLHPEISEAAGKDFFRIVFEEIALKVENRGITAWLFSDKKGVDTVFDLIFKFQDQVCQEGRAVHRANLIKGPIVAYLNQVS